MKTSEMIGFVRWAIDEPKEAVVGDAQIAFGLTLAQNHIANIIRRLDTGFFETYVDLDATAGQNYISIPTDVLSGGIRRLELAGTDTTRGVEVYLARLNEVDSRILYTGQTLLSGQSAFISGSKIYFDQAFSTSETGKYRLWYEKTLTALDANSPDETGDIPEEHHECLCLYTVLLYYAKVEQNPGLWATLYKEKELQLIDSMSRRHKQKARQVVVSPDELSSLTERDLAETIY